MSRTITISDELYERLQAEARTRGMNSIEQLLEQLQTPASEQSDRHQVVGEINDLRQRLLAKYGQLPDSTPLLREDRAR
jgi:predicted CopG family antitoxin